MATATRTYDWKPASRASFRSREDWSLRWWILLALILSVVLHGVLMVGFELLGSRSAEASNVKTVPDRILLNPDLLRQKQAITEIPELIAEGTRPDLDRFEPKLDEFDLAETLADQTEIDLTPSVTEITSFLQNTVNGPGDATAPGPKLADLLGPQSMNTPDLAAEMASVRQDLLAAPVSQKQMLLDTASLDATSDLVPDAALLDEVRSAAGKDNPSDVKVKGFSNLDELLGQGSGKLGGSTAPILMPTDLLFEYGSSELAEGARLSLMKLGFLIQKNPDSLFIVEGHTDSFGSEAYNLDLSLRRANAVVVWLSRSLRLSTDRIDAVGKGKSMPLVSPSGTVEEQSLNRRVEIKVRTRR